MSFPGDRVLRRVDAETAWVRIYDAAYYADGAGFRHYGPHLRGRFDHHRPGEPGRDPDRGVLYATSSFRCAVAEAYSDRGIVAPQPSQRLAVLASAPGLVLADVRGEACLPLGVPAGALRTRDRALTQRVARALYAETGADGIVYEGWFTGEECVVFFERARDRVALVDDRPLDDPALRGGLLVAADALFLAVGDLAG